MTVNFKVIIFAIRFQSSHLFLVLNSSAVQHLHINNNFHKLCAEIYVHNFIFMPHSAQDLSIHTYLIITNSFSLLLLLLSIFLSHMHH
jgi:hypothetical protein